MAGVGNFTPKVPLAFPLIVHIFCYIVSVSVSVSLGRSSPAATAAVTFCCSSTATSAPASPSRRRTRTTMTTTPRGTKTTTGPELLTRRTTSTSHSGQGLSLKVSQKVRNLIQGHVFKKMLEHNGERGRDLQLYWERKLKKPPLLHGIDSFVIAQLSSFGNFQRIKPERK